MKTFKIFFFLLIGLSILSVTLTSCEKETYTYEEFPPEYNEFFKPSAILPIEYYANTRWELTHFWSAGDYFRPAKWMSFEESKAENEYLERSYIEFFRDSTNVMCASYTSGTSVIPLSVTLEYDRLYHLTGELIYYSFLPVREDIMMINGSYSRSYTKYKRIN